ncbi:MAG: hypothetical protein ABIK67_06895 [candidate division WOR-3 bacterium]
MGKFGWQVIKRFYLLGGYGGLITKFYNQFRQKLSVPSPTFLKLLSQGLKVAVLNWRALFLAEHPLVARILANRGLKVFYIHGEIAAPRECAISDNVTIFVPLKSTKNQFVKFGVKPEAIVVTGLVIEPELLSDAEKNFNLRQARLNSNEPLTVAFFISQAYPRPHITKIFLAVESVVKDGMRAIVFTGTNPQKAALLQKRIELIRKRNHQINPKNIMVVQSKNRREENRKTAELMKCIDVIVAASHERTNWAVGLGIPMFVLFPLIGTYAQLNYSFLEECGVAFPLKNEEAAQNLGEQIIKLQKDKILWQAAAKGFGSYDNMGAHFIANFIHNLRNDPSH